MVNIKDISKISGFSTATISRYFNYPESLKNSTKIIIEKVIAETSYRPSGIAQSMRRQLSNSIAIILEEITNPFYSGVLFGAERCAVENNFDIYVINAQEGKIDTKTYNNILLSKGFKGVVFCCDMNEKYNNIIDELVKNKIHIVLLNSTSNFNDKCTTICTNNYKAAFEGTEYLIDKGHNNIGLVYFKKNDDEINQRRQGYIDALIKNKIKFSPSFIYETDSSFEGGKKVAEEILNKSLNHTAIFCLSDQIAIGIIKYFKKLNVRVPEDISILGLTILIMLKLSNLN